MNDSVFEKLQKVIHEELGQPPEKVTLFSLLVEDLECDSLDTVELVMAIEDAFAIDIPDEDIAPFYTAKVGDLVAYIQGRLAA